MSSVSPRLRLAEPRFVADLIDGEVLAVDLTSGAYHNLRGWSAVVFSHLARGATIEEVADAVRSAAPSATVEEIGAFRDRLVAMSMLRDRGDEPVGGGELPVTSAPWEELTVDSYDDMADLILLDPVHEVDPDEGWPRRP